MTIQLPKVCANKGCQTTASHPQAVDYLFLVDDTLVDLCRWCRNTNEAESRVAKAVGLSPKTFLALDLKIIGVTKPKFHQLSRETKRLIKQKEDRYFPPCQIFISDGYTIWRLSDFRYRTETLHTLGMSWEEFQEKHPKFEMIEFD